MLKAFKSDPVLLQAVSQVEALVRARFALAAAATVLVTEIECSAPGCPPLETVIAFWTPDGMRYRLKVFKPVGEVTLDDLPVAWLLPALIDDGDLGCDCC